MPAPAPASLRAPDRASCLLAALGAGYDVGALIGTACATCGAQGVAALLIGNTAARVCARTGETPAVTVARLRAEAGAAPFEEERAKIQAISDRARKLHIADVDARIELEVRRTGRIWDSADRILRFEREGPGWQTVHRRYHARAVAELALELSAEDENNP